MLKNTSTFFSTELNTINLEAETVLASHLQNLDRISNDIRVLEERLRTAAIPFFFIYAFSEEKVTKFRRMKYETGAPGEEVPCGEGLFEGCEDHCLVWGKNADKQYRLSHNIYRSENEIEIYYEEGKKRKKVVYQFKPYLKSSKPLIESKSHVRLKVDKVLVDFYRSLVESLKIQIGDSVVIKDFPEAYLFWESHLSVNSKGSDGKIDEAIFIND